MNGTAVAARFPSGCFHSMAGSTSTFRSMADRIFRSSTGSMKAPQSWPQSSLCQMMSYSWDFARKLAVSFST